MNNQVRVKIMEWTEISSYVKRSLMVGLDEDSIKANLLKAGADINNIENALVAVKYQLQNETPSKSSKNSTFVPTNNQTGKISGLASLKEKKPDQQSFKKESLTSSIQNALNPPQTQVNQPTKPFAPFTPLPENLIKDLKTEEEKPTPFFSQKSFTDILYKKRHVSVILILFIIAFINSLLPSFNLLKTIYPIVNNLPEKVEKAVNKIFPEELEVKIKSGYVSVNVAEPYFINVPKEVFSIFLPEKTNGQMPTSQIRLLAIDTQAKAEDFERYQALALLTNASVVYYSDGKVNIQSLRNIQDLTINKEFILSKFQDFNKNNQIEIFIKIFLVLIPFFIFMMMLSMASMSLFFVSLSMWIITKIKEIEVGFRQVLTYTTSLALVPIFILSLTSLFLPFNLAQNSTISSIFILGLGYTFLTKKENGS